MDVAVKCQTIDGSVVPECFSIKERAVHVVEILDRWPGGDHDYFKVRGDDGSTYILRQEADHQTWSLTFFVLDETHWPHPEVSMPRSTPHEPKRRQ